MEALHSLKAYIKNADTPLAAGLKSCFLAVKNFSFPVIPLVHSTLYALHLGVKNGLANFMRIFYFTPLLKSQLKNKPKNLYLYSGLPQILGNLHIEIGDNTRLSGLSTFSGRTSTLNPTLIIGKNCDIGWQTSITVGTKVIIHDDVRIAGRAFLAGYPGHPIDNDRRARGDADDDSQTGDIILEQGVWLATGVTISAGVTIGQGTIVASGSVVTKSLPAFVLAAGVPAKVVRQL